MCSKHGLQYFAIYGTLLGVVRNQGYIPWDDDIDIAMPRKDYEEFLDIVQKEKDIDSSVFYKICIQIKTSFWWIFQAERQQ